MPSGSSGLVFRNSLFLVHKDHGISFYTETLLCYRPRKSVACKHGKKVHPKQLFLTLTGSTQLALVQTKTAWSRVIISKSMADLYSFFFSSSMLTPAFFDCSSFPSSWMIFSCKSCEISDNGFDSWRTKSFVLLMLMVCLRLCGSSSLIYAINLKNQRRIFR